MATAFTDHYYLNFDTDLDARAGLKDLYLDASLLTWQDTEVWGPVDIMSTLCKPELASVKHNLTEVHAQPIGLGILIVVTCRLVIDGDAGSATQFTETFHLTPKPGGGTQYQISNQIFGLLLG